MLEFIVQRFRLQTEQAAEARLGDIPVMRQRAEGEHIGKEPLAVVFILLCRSRGFFASGRRRRSRC